MPTLVGSSCSTSTTYTIQLLACTGIVTTQNYPVTITSDDCAQTEPVCSPETSMGPGDVPIGFQAGTSSLMTSAPIRPERPVAGPLAPDFTYNGNNPANGGAGRSWFFTYGQTLVANGTTKAVWTDERGFQTTFAGNDASGYQASNPADAEGSVVKIGSDYELRTPDGVRRTFVGGSKGFWKKTVDRWGGGAEGNATTSSRSTLVNELVGGATTGRAITMIYDAVSRVTTLIDVNSGNTRFGYDGSGRLITICAADNDQNCPATTNPWRRFEYDGVTDRLVRVTDALGGIQRAYHYTAAGELD
ncbi:MAG TPA: hypothetical protein VLG15_08380, partial [Thermoanaerobaculia bacterium]|nr:hypothetical protein [Thermoanaerobaculia bacterium]